MNNNTLPQGALLLQRIEALKKQIPRARETWKPKPGESLIGTYIGLEHAPGAVGDSGYMLVRSPFGEVTAVWLTPWLLDAIRHQSPQPGNLIAYTLIAKYKTESGRKYDAYSLIVDKA